MADLWVMLVLKETHLRSDDMPESEVKNAEITTKPKCLRCGAEHTVSDLGHWAKGWWTCAVCNIRWEEDVFD
jgi:transposase-like protein